MDALLGLIIALVVFALLILVISRSFKTLVLVGLVAVAAMILTGIGILR